MSGHIDATIWVSTVIVQGARVIWVVCLFQKSDPSLGHCWGGWFSHLQHFLALVRCHWTSYGDQFWCAWSRGLYLFNLMRLIGAIGTCVPLFDHRLLYIGTRRFLLHGIISALCRAKACHNHGFSYIFEQVTRGGLMLVVFVIFVLLWRFLVI